MKQVIASISYLYKKVFNKPIPEALNIRLKKTKYFTNCSFFKRNI